MRMLIMAAAAACFAGTAMAAEISQGTQAEATKVVSWTAVQDGSTKIWQTARCWVCAPPTSGGGGK